MKLTIDDVVARAAEIAAAYERALVQRVWDGREGEILVQLRARGDTGLVLLCCADHLARVHLARRRPTAPTSPSAFVGLLRKHLLGARLVEVEAPADDRYLELGYERRAATDDPNTPPEIIRLTLVAELWRVRGNLVLLDAERRVLGALRGDFARARQQLTRGDEYKRLEPTRSSAAEPGLTYSTAQELEAAAEHAGANQRALGAVRAVSRDLKRALKRLRRRVSEIAADLERSERADAYQRWGTLLQGAFGSVERGATEVVVTDYYDPELTTVTIPLDPVHSLKDNIARYFKQGRRLTRAKATIARRLAETTAQLAQAEVAHEQLTELLGAVSNAEIERLDEIAKLAGEMAATLSEAGVLRRRRGQRKPQRRGAARAPEPPFRAFESERKKQIWVGRGAAHNDRLTFSFARGRDLWLHVDGAAGAHVVVRLDKGEVPDQDTLIDAATLAAHYSKRREDSIVEVRYTHVRYVRKPRGAPPGSVSMAQSKTVAVRMDSARVRRLFGGVAG